MATQNISAAELQKRDRLNSLIYNFTENDWKNIPKAQAFAVAMIEIVKDIDLEVHRRLPGSNNGGVNPDGLHREDILVYLMRVMQVNYMMQRGLGEDGLEDASLTEEAIVNAKLITTEVVSAMRKFVQAEPELGSRLTNFRADMAKQKKVPTEFAVNAIRKHFSKA